MWRGQGKLKGVRAAQRRFEKASGSPLRERGMWRRISDAFGSGDEGSSWFGPLADPPDRPEVNDHFHGRSPGSRIVRTLAFPACRQWLVERPSPPTVAGAAPDWGQIPHRIPCYPLAGTMDETNLPWQRDAVNRDIRISLYLGSAVHVVKLVSQPIDANPEQEHYI